MLLVRKSVSVQFRMAFGSVYWESVRGSFFSILYLYRWYNHATSFLNGCMGGSKLCG